jgi:tRNA (guanine-N7-)-methyltransferase
VSELMKLYGRRRGRRLRDTPQQLMDELLPKIVVTLPAEGLLDFGNKTNWLEIGFGGGEHLHGQAIKNPDVQLIGCEAFINGIAALLQLLDETPAPNVQVFPEDARLLINKLPDHCIDRVFVLFPDPWPKLRHFKRRLLSDSFLITLGRILKPGGELLIATDDDSYAAWIEARLAQQTLFNGPQGDIHVQPQNWVRTRYQMRAERLGNTCRFYSMRRKIL